MRLNVRGWCLAAAFVIAAFLAGAHAQQPAPPDQPPSLPPADAAAPPNPAQQTEKRIALVIGNGAYQKAPLATAANDAGLIAQTLQAAGFDVVGARDLDGNTLRSSFRDFVDKAQASGPDTVAVVYISGYGLQLAGENYFIPVDSTLSRDVDIPVEGLRVSDYIRQLSALPLKAGVFVLDAAREQPFIEGGGKIASGLALVEPDPRVLIAFNAAPGTVAPEETGNYGAYAQALAEMIRSGGLPLPELFNRVRLRVNDVTKGAQIPWDTRKIESQFVFFDRASDAPPEATPDQSASMRNKPIRDLPAQDAYTAALDRDTLQGYEDFIAAYPGDPMAKRARVIVAARREATTWRRTYRADTPDAYWSYLRRYPNGPHADDARRRLSYLAAATEPPQQFNQFDYDVPPPPPDEYAYVDRPVLMFSDPDFGFAPPPPAPAYFLPPQPEDFIDLAPPAYIDDVYVLPQPVFIPIPVFIRPPIYVRPPRDNLIYSNIHNRAVINNVINRPGGGRPFNGPGGRDVRFVGAAMLPPSVGQRATMIQEGKAPRPPSASINPRDNLRPVADRPIPRGPRGFATNPGAIPNAIQRSGGPGGPGGAPNALPPPGRTLPNAVPQGRELPRQLPRELPRGNALPMPGRGGVPNIPQGGPQGSPQGREGFQGRPQGTQQRGPNPNVANPNSVNPNLVKPNIPGRDFNRGAGSIPGAGVNPGPGRDYGRPGRGGPDAMPGRGSVPQFQRPSVAPQIQRPVPPPRVAPPQPRIAPPPRMAPPMAAPPRPALPPRMAPPPRPAPPPRAAPPPRMAPPPRPAPPPRAPPPAKRCAPGQKC